MATNGHSKKGLGKKPIPERRIPGTKLGHDVFERTVSSFDHAVGLRVIRS